MKYSLRIALVAMALVALSGCFAGLGLEPADVANAFGVGAHDALFAYFNPQQQLALANVPGPSSGSASYTYEDLDGTLSGEIDFSAFEVAATNGDTYQLSGTSTLIISWTYNQNEDLVITAEYDTGDSAVAISKNGETAVDVVGNVTLEITVGWDMQENLVLTIISTGTVNGQDVSGESTITYAPQF